MVEKESAIQKCSLGPEDAYAIDENHSDMVKFAVADLNYTSVLACFRRLLGIGFPKQTPEWAATDPATNDTKEPDTEDHPDEAFLADERRGSSSRTSSQPSLKGKTMFLRPCSPPNASFRDFRVPLAGRYLRPIEQYWPPIPVNVRMDIQ